jgi:hypothetical protein
VLAELKEANGESRGTITHDASFAYLLLAAPHQAALEHIDIPRALEEAYHLFFSRRQARRDIA